KEWLMIEEGMSYDRYFNFKIKVVEPALKEINQKLNMKVSYKENKNGRSVKSLTFIVEDLEPRIYDFNKNKVIKDQISIDELALDLSKNSSDETLLTKVEESVDNIHESLKILKISIAASTIHRLELKYGKELLYNGVSIMCNKSRHGKITAPVKYLTGILENLNNKSSEIELDNSKKLRFNNFEPREYDYYDLERRLLGWDK
ncbi:MAG: RepB family plasmid replication initiator protein, partial [Clostridium sp.]